VKFHQKMTPAERGRKRLIGRQITAQILRSEAVANDGGYRRNWAICETIASRKANWDWKKSHARKLRRSRLGL